MDHQRRHHNGKVLNSFNIDLKWEEDNCLDSGALLEQDNEANIINAYNNHNRIVIDKFYDNTLYKAMQWTKANNAP